MEPPRRSRRVRKRNQPDVDSEDDTFRFHDDNKDVSNVQMTNDIGDSSTVTDNTLKKELDTILSLSQCHYCHEFFNTELLLEQHKASAHADNPNSTSGTKRRGRKRGECKNEALRCKRDLQRILKSLDTQNDDVDISDALPLDKSEAGGGGNTTHLICEWCGRGYKSHCALTNHQRARHMTGTPPTSVKQDEELLDDNVEEVYACADCGKVLKTRTALDIHVRTHQTSTTGEPLKCELCALEFKTHAQYTRHQNRMHEVKNSTLWYQCGDCEKVFEKESVLALHRRVHTGERPYICEVCGKTYSSYTSLKTHIRMHAGANHHCDICQFKTFDKARLDNHMRIHTGQQPYECDVCKTRFNHHNNLKRHQLSHSIDRPFKCDQCEFQCVRRPSLRTHMLTHTGERPFKCSHCTNTYKDRTALRQHIERVHFHVERCACDLCGRTFKQAHRLEAHRRAHNGQNPYKCKICQFQCASQNSLMLHTRRHNGEKPYACSVCDFRCVARTSLVLHMRKHTGEKPYKCTLCERSFASGVSLTVHVRRHKGEKPYQCEFCSYRSPLRSVLNMHMRKHTGEQPYKCSECGKCFRLRSSCVTHLRTHTGEMPYSCGVCFVMFATKRACVKHVSKHELEPGEGDDDEVGTSRVVVAEQPMILDGVQSVEQNVEVITSTS